MMVELAHYTLCLRSGIKPGKVVASGLTRSEAAMAVARNLYRFDICTRAADYETFRSFEMTRFLDESDCVIASATVPKSASFENDKAYALELIEMQILRRAGTLWDGEVYTRPSYLAGRVGRSGGDALNDGPWRRYRIRENLYLGLVLEEGLRVQPAVI